MLKSIFAVQVNWGKDDDYVEQVSICEVNEIKLVSKRDKQ